MNPSTRRRLEEYFELPNRRLYECLGAYFEWWNRMRRSLIWPLLISLLEQHHFVVIPFCARRLPSIRREGLAGM
jgi:hypothetical protein